MLLATTTFLGAAAIRWRSSVAPGRPFLEISCYTHTRVVRPSSSLSITTPRVNAVGKGRGTRQSIGLTSRSPRSARSAKIGTMISSDSRGTLARQKFKNPRLSGYEQRPTQPDSRRLFLALRGPGRRPSGLASFHRNLEKLMDACRGGH